MKHVGVDEKRDRATLKRVKAEMAAPRVAASARSSAKKRRSSLGKNALPKFTDR